MHSQRSPLPGFCRSKPVLNAAVQSLELFGSCTRCPDKTETSPFRSGSDPVKTDLERTELFGNIAKQGTDFFDIVANPRSKQCYMKIVGPQPTDRKITVHTPVITQHLLNLISCRYGNKYPF